ncbi:MAG: hypothetical protein IT548_17560 [Alphaproteobacteria bacterium]|nr:hypothetical protein [Alphaproteobacteria bacterium]
MRVILAALIAVLLSGHAFAEFGWPQMRERWSKHDERGYERFVATLADADCHTVRDCLGPAHNPLAAGDPPGLVFSADCADLVYMLRAYYAWKHGLPFSFLTQIEARQGMGEGDLKTTVYGNRPVARFDVVEGTDIRQVLDLIRNTVSTATFRIDPRIEQPVAQDFYSPAITRAALRPGSAIYNGDGHVVIVSKIDNAGRIHFIDAHPDMSITRGVYSGQYQRGEPAIGAGFHAWRPFAQEKGVYAYAANAQIAGYSLEQYFGLEATNTDWTKADYSDSGRNADFVEFTRRRLAKGRLRYDVIEEARLGFARLCDDIQDRQRFVDDALAQGLQRTPRPGTLEGATPADRSTWLVYSTPGRDRRLRAHVAQLGADLTRYIAMVVGKTGEAIYRGKSLRSDLQLTFDRADAECRLGYTNTDGSAVTLTLKQVLARLPHLSFDPYHCAERRWGASGPELERCDEDGLKARWYQAEAPLRQLKPIPGISPGATLDVLLALPPPSELQPPSFEAIFSTAPGAQPHKRRKRH